MALVVIIDNYPILRSSLIKFVSERFSVNEVLAFPTVEHLGEGSITQTPDLVIMGISQNVPVSNINMILMIKAIYPVLNIILYDEKADPGMIKKYLEAGVKGYVSKQNSLTYLQEGIAHVLEGNYYLCPEVFVPEIEDYLIKIKKETNF